MQDVNRLKLVLVEQKKTNKWLSEELGVSPSTVSKWIGYDCYDLINGRSNAYPGLKGAMQEEPYCRFSSGVNPAYDNYVAFDYDKKEIFVLTTSGCCTFTDTWAKYFEGDSLGNQPCVKVVKQEHLSFENGIETIETYALQNDKLKMIGVTNRRF